MGGRAASALAQHELLRYQLQPRQGGDLGGLEGADRHCQELAQAVGAGSKTWHAYLSTQPTNGVPAVNVRDRIGTGPWYNAKGVEIAANLDDLHSDNNYKINKTTALTEKGKFVNGRGDTPTQHDMSTGSQHDGTALPAGEDKTCHNWTSSSEGSAIVGHTDLIGDYAWPKFLELLPQHTGLQHTRFGEGRRGWLFLLLRRTLMCRRAEPPR